MRTPFSIQYRWRCWIWHRSAITGISLPSSTARYWWALPYKALSPMTVITISHDNIWLQTIYEDSASINLRIYPTIHKSYNQILAMKYPICQPLVNWQVSWRILTVILFFAGTKHIRLSLLCSANLMSFHMRLYLLMDKSLWAQWSFLQSPVSVWCSSSNYSSGQ